MGSFCNEWKKQGKMYCFSFENGDEPIHNLSLMKSGSLKQDSKLQHLGNIRDWSGTGDGMEEEDPRRVTPASLLLLENAEKKLKYIEEIKEHHHCITDNILVSPVATFNDDLLVKNRSMNGSSRARERYPPSVYRQPDTGYIQGFLGYSYININTAIVFIPLLLVLSWKARAGSPMAHNLEINTD
ncbi:unnamed protein product [Darwinula stevensoni]|uniref:Uncharacterized protein n=1 Tax=Darwinula stevensoni TaxID=69355 RepID=A0A7R8XB87_9CRUS|nr:unnamed protein product [Darwinula stevensoni]CAG0892117.1 unnamed protein product [Darwinula stevensoni]